MDQFGQRSDEDSLNVTAFGSRSRSRIDLGPLGFLALRYLRANLDLVPDLDRWIIPPTRSSGGTTGLPVVRVLLADVLAGDVDDVFAWIDPIPLSQDPLTQIHSGRTVGGREVAIKIRVPEAGGIIARALPGLLSAMDFWPTERDSHPPIPSNLSKGFEFWLATQIDAPAELANLEQLRRGRSDHSTHTIPRPRADLSGSRVVTFEVQRGIPLETIIQGVSENRLDHFAGLDVDPLELGNNLMRAVLHQIFVMKTFVSDLAPEHIFALADGRVSFLDFTNTGRIDPVVRRKQFGYVAAIDAVDVERMLRGIDDLVEAQDREATEGFAVAFRRRMHEWQRAPEWEEAPAERLAHYLLATSRLAREHGLRPHELVMKMVRTLAAADAIAKQLSPRSGLGAVAPAFFSSGWLWGFVNEVFVQRFSSLGFDLVDLLTDSPGNLVRILSDVADQRFVLRVQTIETAESRQAAATRARLVAVACLLVGISIVGAALRLSANASIWAWSGVAATGGVLLLTFAVLWRRLG